MTIDPTDDALRDHLRRQAGAATVTATPRPLIEARAGRIRTRRRRTRWAVAVAVVLLGLGGGLLAVRALASHPDETKMENSGPTTSESTTTLDPNVAQIQGSAPPPSYPEEVRGPLVDAYNALSFCMHNHGVPDYPTLPDNFGDGTVPNPVENGDEPNMQAAIEACQAENEVLREAALRANDAIRPGPSTTESPPADGAGG